MLPVAVHGPSSTYLLECCGDRPINCLQAFQCSARCFDISGAIGGPNSLVTPACLGMAPQVAG
jgi:hypothetical protein